jgi:hypothetical protein
VEAANTPKGATRPRPRLVRNAMQSCTIQCDSRHFFYFQCNAKLCNAIIICNTRCNAQCKSMQCIRRVALAWRRAVCTPSHLLRLTYKMYTRRFKQRMSMAQVVSEQIMLNQGHAPHLSRLINTPHTRALKQNSECRWRKSCQK